MRSQTKYLTVIETHTCLFVFPFTVIYLIPDDPSEGTGILAVAATLKTSLRLQRRVLMHSHLYYYPQHRPTLCSCSLQCSANFAVEMREVHSERACQVKESILLCITPRYGSLIVYKMYKYANFRCGKGSWFHYVSLMLCCIRTTGRTMILLRIQEYQTSVLLHHVFSDTLN